MGAEAIPAQLPLSQCRLERVGDVWRFVGDHGSVYLTDAELDEVVLLQRVWRAAQENHRSAEP